VLRLGLEEYQLIFDWLQTKLEEYEGNARYAADMLRRTKHKKGSLEPAAPGAIAGAAGVKGEAPLRPRQLHTAGDRDCHAPRMSRTPQAGCASSPLPCMPAGAPSQPCCRPA
jgi:hypothetical protein